METGNSIRHQVKAKLADLQLLISTWSGGLWLLMGCGGVAIAALVVSRKDWQSQDATFIAALVAGLVALFGHLFSKLADFRKQHIDIEYAALDRLETIQKRLIAFHAEISENLMVLYDIYSPARRTRLIGKIVSDVNAKRFTKADTSNPIFEDNREHIYEFAAPVIRTVINYYNLENNLNVAVEALTTDDFNKLSASQKLQWYVYKFNLVNEVASAGSEALAEIEKQVDRQSQPFLRRPATGWQPIDEAELQPFLEEMERLPAAGTRQSRRSEG